LKTKQVRPQRRLLGGESAVGGDRISPLESHRQPLEQVCCFPGDFSDGCHSSAQHIIIIIIIIIIILFLFFNTLGIIDPEG